MLARLEGVLPALEVKSEDDDEDEGKERDTRRPWLVESEGVYWAANLRGDSPCQLMVLARRNSRW